MASETSNSKTGNPRAFLFIFLLTIGPGILTTSFQRLLFRDILNVWMQFHNFLFVKIILEWKLYLSLCHFTNIVPETNFAQNCRFFLFFNTFLRWYLWRTMTNRGRQWLKTRPRICTCTSYHSGQLLRSASDKKWIQVHFGDFALYYRLVKTFTACVRSDVLQQMTPQFSQDGKYLCSIIFY